MCLTTAGFCDHTQQEKKKKKEYINNLINFIVGCINVTGESKIESKFFKCVYTVRKKLENYEIHAIRHGI